MPLSTRELKRAFVLAVAEKSYAVAQEMYGKKNFYSMSWEKLPSGVRDQWYQKTLCVLTALEDKKLFGGLDGGNEANPQNPDSR